MLYIICNTKSLYDFILRFISDYDYISNCNYISDSDLFLDSDFISKLTKSIGQDIFKY